MASRSSHDVVSICYYGVSDILNDKLSFDGKSTQIVEIHRVFQTNYYRADATHNKIKNPHTVIETEIKRLNLDVFF